MTDRPTAEDQLRDQVRTALRTKGISQAEAARQLGLSTKHLNQMLTGHQTLTLTWAEGILGLAGYDLLLFAVVPPGVIEHTPRIRLDDLTSDQLDGLYDDLDRADEVIGEMNERAISLERRAARRNR